MTKKYSSNYSSALTVLAMHAVILSVSYYELGTLEISSLSATLLLGVLLFAWWLDQKTWLSITDKTLTSSGQFDIRGSEKVSIHTVKEVRRVRQNILISNFGSFMAFYGDDGLLMKVRESNYSRKTIKQFMSDLKTELPFTTFDPQYEELISKPLEELPNFKRIPATYDGF